MYQNTRALDIDNALISVQINKYLQLKVYNPKRTSKIRVNAL